MYAAINKEGILVYASEAHPAGKWYCPDCGGEMVFKISSRGKKYFSHLVACGKTISPRSAGETDEHSNFKKYLSWGLERAEVDYELEYMLETSDQIADVFIPDLKLAVEYQHSPLSASELKTRENLYQRQNCQAIWVIDGKLLNESFNSAWKKTVLQHHPSIGYYWLAYDEPRLSFIIHHHLPLLYQGHNVSFKKTWLSLKSNWLEPLKLLKTEGSFSFNSSPETIYKNHYQPNYQRELMSLKRQKSNQKTLQQLYQNGFIIDNLPEWMLVEGFESLIFDEKMVFVFSWIYLTMSKLGEFSFGDLSNVVSELISIGHLTLHGTPLLKESPLGDFLKELLVLLEKRGTIVKINQSKWRVRM